MPYIYSIMCTLYRRSGDSEAQWRVWAEKSDDPNIAYLYTEFGQVGGALRQSRREITERGREESVFAKAQQQVRKKWQDKQAKEGYLTTSSEEEPRAKLNRLEQVDEADAPILPMLANKAEFQRDKGTIKGMKFPLYVQPKIDGFRCVSSLQKDNVRIFSRTNIPYIGFETLRDTLSDFKLPSEGFGSGRLYLDGELYISDMNFNTLSGLIKRGQHHADYDLPAMRYILFDCFDLDHMDTSFKERYAFLKKIVPQMSRVSTLTVLKASSLKDVDAYMRTFLAEGHEGIMLRDPDSPYILRKRSKYLLKHKEFQDEEFTIIGFKEGNGDDKGTIVWECMTDTSMSFSVRPTGTREYRSELFANAASYIGKQLTVTFQEKSDDGIPRFPVGKAIREDD